MTLAPPSASNEIPPCVLQCLTQAALSTGCGMEDKHCACTNISFQEGSRTCIKSNCSPLEQAAAAVLQDRRCAAVSSTSPTTSTAPPSSTLSIANSGCVRVNFGWVAIAGALGLAVGF
ncbi:hypothetical protein AN958_00102 [Leucoagaricus sp. SymC.cos]|nr:hypothetical protein AN958_00102 [Leucoagaricus sp. SymC.cos]